MRYAGFWIRFCASVLDSLVFIPFAFVIGTLEAAGLFSIWSVASWLVGWLYYALMESSGWQATLGKRVCGIRVTDLGGGRITFGRATGRYFAKILSWATLYIGYLMVAFTERKQGLHDILAGTLVLHGKAEKPVVIYDDYAEDSATERIYADHDTGSKVVIAGFDTNGHVIRLTFDMNDPKLQSEGILIGRDSRSCDLVVADNSISRVHARIFEKNGDLYVVDMGSTNGTVLDGKKLTTSTPARMQATGSLMLGDIDLSIGKY